MSKKKILAGLLSLAMAASLAPMSVLADENTGRSFTNAWGDVINQNECLYYEDFEGDTGSDFDIADDIQNRGFWHSAITEVDGNKAMKYYITPNATVTDGEGNETTVEYNAADGKKLINSKEIIPKTEDINNTGWYEIGYTYYPGKMRGFMYDLMTVNLNNNGTPFMALGSHNSSYPHWITWNKLHGLKLTDANVTWNGTNPIEFKEIIDLSTGKTRIYVKYGKSSYYEMFVQMNGTTSIKHSITDSSNVTIKMSCEENPVTTATRMKYTPAEDPNFRIDNFYVRKLEHDTPTVTFDNDGELTPVKVNYFKQAAIPARPAKDGYIFIGWYNGNTRVDGTDEKPVTTLSNVTEDMTITAKWVKKSVVTFESNGGTPIDPITTETGSITLPDSPFKEGYSFMGWYYDNGTFERPFDGTDVAESVTVYARWDEYLVKEDFESYTSGLFDIDPAITAKGYWHSDVVDDGTGNMYMKYYITPSDNVTFDSADAAKLINREILASTKAINKNGWYEIGYTYYPNNMRAYMDDIMSVNMSNNTRNTTMKIGSHNAGTKYYLSWNNQHGISTDPEITWNNPNPIKLRLIVNMNSGEERVYAEYADKSGETVNKILGLTIGNNVTDSGNIQIKMSCLEDPIITATTTKINSWGGTFGAAAEPSFMIDDFYVKELNTATPTVTFINGADVTTQKANYFNEVTLPELTKENFKFVGWFTENDEKFTGTDVTSDITVYAKWSGTYNVTFNANGGKFTDGSETKSIDVDSETPAAIDEEPTRDGYKFCGWFTDSSCVTEFNGTVYENTTVYARWQTTPTIVSVTPENGSSGIELKPEVAITFDSEIDDTTLTKDNIKILKDGTELSESLYNIASSLNAQRKTVVKITFTTELEASKEYTIKVSKAVKNQYSELADDYTSSFTTKSLKLNVEKISVKRGDTDVTDLSAVKGQKIKVTLKLTNAAGVGYTTIYSFRNGNALVSAHSPENTGDGETVESELTVPENAQSLDLIVLDGLSTLKPLTGKTSIIE